MRALLPIAALAVVLAACAGPPIPAPIDDEIVCGDFEMGAARTKMEGSLQYPVRLRIMDGKSTIMKVVLPGLRTPDSPRAKSLIVDDDNAITLEWAQCENERAPRPAPEGPEKKPGKDKDRPSRDVTHFECGDAKVYKTEELHTKKHDPASHVIHFATPPNAACWTSEVPTTTSPDAGTP